jgi:hypothetical protein
LHHADLPVELLILQTLMLVRSIFDQMMVGGMMVLRMVGMNLCWHSCPDQVPPELKLYPLDLMSAASKLRVLEIACIPGYPRSCELLRWIEKSLASAWMPWYSHRHL